MSSDAIQITIPDFDDEEFTSTPIPFGRSAGNGFGTFGGSGFGSGQDSPTSASMTPVGLPERPDRHYFHSRGDSFNSDDSSHSRTPSRPTPFAHSSQSSVATTSSSPFTKKPSFASIRNAFKSGKTNDAPPVPQIDHQAYPALRNPFNRSTSSLPHVPTLGGRKQSVTASPPQPRAPTPSSTKVSKSRNHSYTKSQHSLSGSIFHMSDGGSDHAFSFSSSPPPVPRVPDAFGGSMMRSDSPLSLESEEKIVLDPRTPSDYALHAVFIRFATSAELKIDSILREALDHDPLLSDSMGPGVDTKFDEILQSLGQIAQKHTKPVVDSVMRWRKGQNDPVGPEIVRLHLTQSPVQWNRGSNRSQDPSTILNERKSLASIYIMCRALISVLQSISRDALGEMMGYNLEETTFEQFRKPDLKLLAQSANHRLNSELYATLLGHIANIRFVSVTDRFLAELNTMASGQVPKELEAKYEHLVQGLKYIQIKVWPPECFEEAAEFMESLAKLFANVHGLRLKTAFAETLVQLLHPIGKTAQAEVNHPQWAKAIETIYPRARDMINKPRYWSVAYPLLVTSLCVAPQQFFLRHWTGCFEVGLNKMKEKSHRLQIMNGMVRLVWTYLYRCQEPASTSTAKLDMFLKRLFPSNRLSIFPPEEPLEPFIYITHFVLSRHFEFGRDFCLELLQEQNINSGQPTNITNLVAPERMATAVQAILLSLHCIERETSVPTWPSSTDFSVVPSWDDYPSSSSFVPETLLSKPSMQDFFDRCNAALATVAISCGASIGHMSIYDEQWSVARLNPMHEESHSFVIRRHLEGTVAYPSQLAGPIGMLQTCFQSWPRCLHPTLPVGEAIDMLLRGVIHVEPSIGEAAAAAVKRFMPNPQHASVVLERFAVFLFGSTNVIHEGSGTRLPLESPRLLNLWVALVDTWIHGVVPQIRGLLTGEDRDAVRARCDEIEAGALVLLSHVVWFVHCTGVKIIRLLGLLSSKVGASDASADLLKVSRLFHGEGLQESYLHGYDELLDKPDFERLEQWRVSTHPDTPLRIADSDHEKDRHLWRFVFPRLMHETMEHLGPVQTLFRETLVAAASRYHPLMAHLAGLSSRVPAGLSRGLPISEKDGYRLVKENNHLIDQWHVWVKILCSTASPSDARPALTSAGRDHSRAPSDTSFERERMTTTRGLFRYLTPFLDSEYTPFRNAAVLCISSLPSSGYPQLLEDLNLLASRQFYDESRIKPSVTPVTGRRRQERLHSAVARIYYLTAHFLQHQRSAGRQAALAHVLKFVRNTQTFLTTSDMRDNHTLQRLRRYFCGTVERLFDGLSALKDSDRFIPSHMHLSLYRLCEEWCQFGPQSDYVKQRLILMQRASAASVANSHEPDSVEKFQHETKLLSVAAVGALSALCQKAFFPPDISSGSPTERLNVDYLRPLEVSVTLERLNAILASPEEHVQGHGRKALRLLLAYHGHHNALLEEALRRAFVSSKEPGTGDSRFFEVVADVICDVDNHGFTFSQVVCLGLSNLSHPRLEVRRRAFEILEVIHLQSSGMFSLAQFEAAIGSSAPSAYLRTHRLISDLLAGEHPFQASEILFQFAPWLPLIQDGGSGKVPLLLLQSLEGWISNIDLMFEDKSSLSRQGISALYHLMSLTLRYSATHAEQILVLWMRLVDSHPSNAHATIRFLLEQSPKVGNTLFIDCAANVVACLSQTATGRSIFEELCGTIEPTRMPPSIDHKLNFPAADDIELWSDLDDLFAGRPKPSLGAAQYALLFLADITLERQWDLQDQLPILLHAIFVHLDHRVPFVRQQARRMLFQLMRAWSSGYDELPDRSAYLNRSLLAANITGLEKESESNFWKEEDSVALCEEKMGRLCAQVLRFMEPLTISLAEKWGTLALNWGTACSIRQTAFRSLQIFRAIMPRADKSDLGLILGRFANSIADPSENVHAFTSEIIITLNALSTTEYANKSILPQLFWCAYGSLSTTVEHEFQQTLVFLSSLLEKVNLDDPETAELLITQQPQGWVGPVSLQSSLLAGLRSSATYGATFQLLQSLSKVQDHRLIDSSGDRVRDLYTLVLPWCLHAMTNDVQDDSLHEFSRNICRLADEEERYSISRIMESFVKNRFRTKDDFLRQSVGSLREHYGVDHWTEVVTLLLGLVLNREHWLRVHSLQILKVLFQQRETRSPVDLLGSELLMPLLRLLETDLAPQALEVLDEPMMISGGLSAKQVLRMSLRPRAQVKDVESVADVFGVPEESGWCVAKIHSRREACRSNLLAVFDTCKLPTRPSRIEFEPEVEIPAEATEEDLGGLVQNLHELTTFFQDERPRPPPLPIPSQQLEARVAAILAKSTEAPSDVPQTPMFDVFKVGNSTYLSDDSDDESDESEDAFIFDSPTVYRSAPNGSSLH